MGKITIWEWDKKKRTLLRSIKPGNIFCFQIGEGAYCFGRIISKIMTGHVAEIFDYTSESPVITEKLIKQSSRLFDPIVLDSYSLFDQKLVGEWRMVGLEDDYTPLDIENIYFTYGVFNSCKRVDVFGNEVSISSKEAEKLPRLSPLRDIHIKELIKAKIDLD